MDRIMDDMLRGLDLIEKALTQGNGEEDTMRRYCYSVYHKGNRFMGEKEPLRDKSDTHGLCDECLKRELEDIIKLRGKSCSGQESSSARS